MIKLKNRMIQEEQQKPAPVKPGKNVPAKPDVNPDPTQPRPGGNEPEKNDPTRIEEPGKTDPTRIDDPPAPAPGKPGSDG